MYIFKKNILSFEALSYRLTKTFLLEKNVKIFCHFLSCIFNQIYYLLFKTYFELTIYW